MKCNDWGKSDEEYMEPFCTIFATSCESFIIHNKKLKTTYKANSSKTRAWKLKPKE